jgi:hypothetical protein
MMAILPFLWEKTPNYIKWPISIGFFLFLIPLKLRDEAYGLIDSRVHAVIVPMREKRDMQILSFEERLERIEKNTENIQLILMKRRGR